MVNNTHDQPGLGNEQNSRKENQHQGAQEGQYKNIEQSVNNKETFNDDYEVGQEDEMSQQEMKTEDENNTPNPDRH